MSKVVVIIGLPGCGKTHLLKSYVDYVQFDDIKLEQRKQLINALMQDQNVVIADPFLCIPTNQQKCAELLEQYDKEIEWIYFANDPEACLINVRYRNDGRAVEQFISMLTKTYEPGPNARSIWQPAVEY